MVIEDRLAGVSLFSTPFSFDRLHFPIPFFDGGFHRAGERNDSGAQAREAFRW